MTKKRTDKSRVEISDFKKAIFHLKNIQDTKDIRKNIRHLAIFVGGGRLSKGGRFTICRSKQCLEMQTLLLGLFSTSDLKNSSTSGLPKLVLSAFVGTFGTMLEIFGKFHAFRFDILDYFRFYYWFFKNSLFFSGKIFRSFCIYLYLPTPPLGQDMAQGQFLSEV